MSPSSPSDNPSRQEQFELLAALHAAGGLEGEELAEYEAMLAGASKDERKLKSALEDVSSLLAMSAASSPGKVDPGLKDQILEKLDELDAVENASADVAESTGSESSESPRASGGPPEGLPDFVFTGSEEGEWRPLPVKGARLKELTNDRRSPYVVFLLDLAPGVKFPGHRHHGTEDTYLLSGDLHIAGRVMGPGDHMRSEPGTRHSRSHTVKGCRALIITARENYHSRSIRAYGLVHKAVSKVAGIFKPGDN